MAGFDRVANLLSDLSVRPGLRDDLRMNIYAIQELLWEANGRPTALCQRLDYHASVLREGLLETAFLQQVLGPHWSTLFGTSGAYSLDSPDLARQMVDRFFTPAGRPHQAKLVEAVDTIDVVITTFSKLIVGDAAALVAVGLGGRFGGDPVVEATQITTVLAVRPSSQYAEMVSARAAGHARPRLQLRSACKRPPGLAQS
jgi:hypothetical protein